MYIVDGIAYEENTEPMLVIFAVKPLEQHRFWVTYNNGETKVSDF